MSDERRLLLWRRTVAFALLAGVTVVVSSLAQSPNGKWWPGYGGAADNSRYFTSRQVNKSNVSQLQVAWTYPFGDTSFGPIVVRGVIYGRGRSGSLVAVDAKTGKELWKTYTIPGPGSSPTAFYMDNFRWFGPLTCIPEPSVFALGAVGFIAMVLLKNSRASVRNRGNS